MRSIPALAAVLALACGARSGLDVREDDEDGGRSIARRTLSMSWDHACATDSDARVACWGSASLGLTGPAADPDGRPARIPGLEGIVEIAVGQLIACALDGAGAVWCWGDVIGSRAPLRATTLPVAERLVVGSSAVCVITPERGVACTGLLFPGSSCTDHGAPPTLGTLAVPAIDRVVDLAIGQRHACAARDDGSIWCWGCDRGSTLGTVDGERVDPVRVEGVSGTRVSAETGATCAWGGGRTTCWGDGSQFGTSLTIAPTGPREAAFAARAIDVDVGVVFTCAAERDAVACDGALYDWAGGCDDHRVREERFAIPALRELSIGYQDACARDARGTVWCWGCNGSGAVGDGTRSGHATPIAVPL